MKNDLTCGVVRDLLPPFVEGLTSEETNRAVERHLAECPACAQLRADMVTPAGEERAEQSREVDYLKRVKHRNERRVVLAVLCTVLLFLAGFALKVFVIGTPAQEQELAVTAFSEENGVLRLSVMTPYSATAYHGWKVEVADGVANISARSVMVSPLFPNGGRMVEVPLDGVKEVRLCGRVVWQDGTAIQEQVARLYKTRTPYVGDISALGQIANALNVQGQCGSYTNSLHTSSRPYSWTLEFSGTCTEKKAAQLDEIMEHKLAPLMLALVDNLDQVIWTYTIYGSPQTRTVTAEEASARWAEGGSIKDCALSPASLQHLCDRLEEQ